MAEFPGGFDQLVLASSNPGKLRELSAMLKPLGITVRTQGEWAIEDAVEDGLTFVENALIKARHASKHTGLPALGDDSGLAVDALQGALQLRPDSLDVLIKLRDVFIDTRQHQKAADTIERLIEVEGRPRRLVELHSQVADLLRRESLRPDGSAA